MKIFKPEHVLRNINRLKQIIQTLIKYGFGYLIDKVHLQKYIGLNIALKKINKEILHLSPAIRFRKILEELGPTFIKLGQILSTRSDLIPLMYCHELEKLQDNTPSIEFEKIKAILEQELQNPLKILFQYFSEKPLASASVAQIHLAQLTTGEEVVVKIIKPGIRETILADIEILLYLAQLSEKYFKNLIFTNPIEIIRELRKSILEELNLGREARNIKKFQQLLCEEKNIVLTKLFESYTTEHILVLEHLKGFKVTDLEKINSLGYTSQKLARDLAKAVFQQIFVYRFFHADPHPGNILILKNHKIAFIDFGSAGRLNEGNRKLLIKILSAVINKDLSSLIFYMKKLIIFQKDIDENKFQSDVENFIEEYYDYPLSEIDLEKLFGHLIDIISHYDIKIPSHLFLLMKTLITLEAIEREIDPAFNIVKEIKPFVRHFLLEEYSLREIGKNLKKFIFSTTDLFNELPLQLHDIVQKIEKGSLKVQFDFLGINRLIHNLNRITIRLIYSIISASLLIGSFFIINTNLPPLAFGYPLFAVMGFTIALFLLILLLFDILRHRWD